MLDIIPLSSIKRYLISVRPESVEGFYGNQTGDIDAAMVRQAHHERFIYPDSTRTAYIPGLNTNGFFIPSPHAEMGTELIHGGRSMPAPTCFFIVILKSQGVTEGSGGWGDTVNRLPQHDKNIPLTLSLSKCRSGQRTLSWQIPFDSPFPKWKNMFFFYPGNNKKNKTL